ncbi:MAG: hypothetical protein FWG90_01150, partial [Oscillospiraceae bacterium]|nr:hypothetical protein [Oscillospiraceae bacterium]
MSDNNYHIRRGKYITIRPPNGERGVRTYRLGVGYSEKDLEYRLLNRDKEYSVAAIMQRYKGIQIEYALCLRKLQITVYHKKPNPKRHTIRDIQQMGELLTYMHRHNICNRNDFENRIEDITAANEDKNLNYLLMIIELFEAGKRNYLIKFFYKSFLYTSLRCPSPLSYSATNTKFCAINILALVMFSFRVL